MAEQDDKKKRRPQTQAEKRHIQSLKRRLRNRMAKKIIKTYTKRTLESLAAKDLTKAEADFRATIKKLDKAGVRRVMHPNTAARRKSRLSRIYRDGVAKAQAAAS